MSEIRWPKYYPIMTRYQLWEYLGTRAYCIMGKLCWITLVFIVVTPNTYVTMVVTVAFGLTLIMCLVIMVLSMFLRGI